MMKYDFNDGKVNWKEGRNKTGKLINWTEG